MRRLIKRTLAILILLGLIGAAGSYWAVQQTRQIPDFYARATHSDIARREFVNQQMELGVQQLRHDAGRVGSWRASFTDGQINAWLQNELPQKFPRLLAVGAENPRIVIEGGKILAACRYRNRHLDTVISCELEVQLTEEPNMMAFRVSNLRAGALPLPLGKFVRGISKEAARGDIDIRWDHTVDEPVALVVVPSEHPKYVVSPVIVENVSLNDGGLTMSGHSGPEAHDFYHPAGPLHRFVSYRPGEGFNRYMSDSNSTIR